MLNVPKILEAALKPLFTSLITFASTDLIFPLISKRHQADIPGRLRYLLITESLVHYYTLYVINCHK